MYCISSRLTTPSTYLRVFVLNFIAGNFVRAIVSLNTNVSNAKGHIALLSAIFVAQHENRLQFLTVQPSCPLPTPVKLKPLAEFFTGYHNDIVEFLISGFSQGFRLQFQGERHSLAGTNLISALQNPQAVDMKL